MRLIALARRLGLASLLRASLAASTLALVFAACGGTVVFEEQGEGTGGNGTGGSGSGANGDGGASISTASQAASVVAPQAVSGVGPGGGLDDVTSVGPSNGGAGPGQGPGQGPGPSGGGFDPTGAGGEGPGPGPSGVGGADVGPVGSVGVSTSGGCNQSLDETNQYCYLVENCEDYRVEMECELNGQSPYTCWCYQDSQYVGQCDQSVAGCRTDSCCADFWVLPG